ncbi:MULTISPECIES: Rpp14/Pop5 family protein [Methanoculleus]|uniref:Ribonuclease P protein component 2 n=2 Tax=Methanoculleus TaxID=45989 RepID=RNP2_METMJ|nr:MULTISPECIES: Rpp14/Pop5 family protein [Methanoculleus]A3CW56.1 RecName: Full=Ribonuclease P protein component 2; Short=RNase P component 2; AltName: Full=Pop5 [Methanoculleus marisnigri JR1]ABN57606.1 Ribonuclease P-related protein [Methanoculleus marisnigri JR1]UYU19003.1 Rpp14/Pop5 family protein [Methanoculleus submarinus]
MRPRPPAMRTKRRYILARILPYRARVDQKQMYFAVIEAATSLLGDAAAGLAQPAVVFCEGGYVVVRCRRGTEKDVAVALSTVTAVADERIALRTVATSGTIHALRRRMRSIRQLPGDEEVKIGETYFAVYRYPRQKVDLVEKGIKHQKSLFFTEADLEER